MFRGTIRTFTPCALTAVLALGVAPAAWAQDADASLRGIVKTLRQASISSDLGFKIVALPFREGQSFKVGETLVEFDCEGLRAELAGAQARLATEQLNYKNNVRLAKLNAAGNFEVQLSKYKADQAAAEIDAFNAKVEQCAIKAPFDGRIAASFANTFETPERSRPFLQIVGDKALEIEMLLPSAWLRWLKVGAKFDIQIEETLGSIPSKVVRIAPIVDPVSQTVKVIAEFDGDTSGVLPGMSGPVRFAPHSR